jgi:hypothetical protein
MLALVAIVLVLHGCAHLVGFAGAWQLTDDIPYKTTLLGGAVDVGAAGIRAFGLLWLAAALAFVVAGIAVLLRASWWPAYTVITAAASLLLCVLALPDAQVGAAFNAVLLGFLFTGMRFSWFELAPHRASSIAR